MTMPECDDGVSIFTFCLLAVSSLLQMADKLIPQTQLGAPADWRITSAPSSTSLASLPTAATAAAEYL